MKNDRQKTDKKIHYLKDSVKKKYFDESEEILFKFFDLPQSKKFDQIQEILTSNPPWTVLYHLTPQRQHLLDWFPFSSNSSLLDIGSGCGSLTGLFCRKLAEVTCLELTEIRAQIIANRWQDKNNLRIFCGSLEALDIKEKFDYVNLTGVLEYAGMFSQNPNNPDNFTQMPIKILKRASSLLKDSGTLIVAIENPLGVRYFAGAVEDHYGQLYEGIENYPQYNGIRTFTKTELWNMLFNLGFKDIEFYFPIPDYKLPTVVLSEKYLKKYNGNSLSSLMQTVEYSHNPLFNFFSEVLLSFQLNKETILDKFMNSFLIIAKKN